MVKITIDIMKKNGLYYDTMRIEPQLYMICDFFENTPVVSISALRKEIERRRPTLRGTSYVVLSCNNNYLLNYD